MASPPAPKFRVEAVRVTLPSGLPRKKLAADFAASFLTLSRRIQRDQRYPEKPAAPSDLECQVAELRKENRMRREGKLV